MKSIKIHHNSQASARPSYHFTDILSVRAAREIQREMQKCPHFEKTQLLSLDGVARKAGVGKVSYKDESSRFGMVSFKSLGGAYAVAKLLAEHVTEQVGHKIEIGDLTKDRYRSLTQNIMVTTATDGNHGRSVAAGAQVFGCQCTVFIHENVSTSRENAIAEFGAKVVRIEGNYDDSVRASVTAATDLNWVLVSDTSWPGYVSTPASVMQGYTVMALEIIDQLSAIEEKPPTHVFLQAGVGGLAAAIVAHLWEEMGKNAPRFIIVEPETANCLFQSAQAGHIVADTGSLDTIMAGLACGEPSLIAWEILSASAEYFVTIPDTLAIESMKLLAKDASSSGPIVAGESATAGLAALLAIVNGDDLLAKQMGLDQSAHVLLIGTEGATDPQFYNRVVGQQTSSK